MNTKYYNDAIIGNKNMVASYTKKGELLRIFYPSPDYKQFVDFFHTGVKINDSNLIYCHNDINNKYEQYYIENTNILNTEVINTYFNLKIVQTDFVPIKENILLKKYTFINESKIDLNIDFFIHSKINNEDNSLSARISNNALIQYSHDYTVSIFSKRELSSYQIHNSKEKILQGNISDKDYIGMSKDSSISYNIGIIKPDQLKTIEIIINIEDNNEKSNIIEIEQNIERLKKIDYTKQYMTTKKYWNKYIIDHDGLDLLQTNRNKIDEKIEKIYKRTILLFPLLINQKTGGISAAVEIDEDRTTSGGYSYCWPRDAVFITKAFDILKMEKETEKFYKSFCKNTQSKNGMWEQRFYTDGRLAPCWGYQIDETASVVYGIYQHYLKTKEIKFLKENLKMCENATSFLKKYLKDIINKENKIQVSYDIWEMNEGIHLYSLASIFSALECMIKIYDIVKPLYNNNRLKIENILKEQEILRKQLIEIKKYILSNLYDKEKKCFVRNIKQKEMDISILGAVVPFNIFSVKEKNILNTVERINLTLRTYTGGYKRFEKDHYRGGNPWSITTLWMALYYTQAGEKIKAKECLKFIINSSTGHGFLGEQVNNETMKTSWVIGLGWAHAMFILILENLFK